MRRGERHSTSRIVIFNHKGGVGKTTLTINIAWTLAKLGKKVLLVDTDPQVNITTYLIEEDVVKDLLDNSGKPDGQTLWSALKPLYDGLGDIKKIRPIKIGDNLLLLPGDIKLSLFEQEINAFYTDTIQRRTRGHNGLTAISYLVNEISRDKNIDYVFFDTGPNIGPLNKILFLDCDYFIVPAACDLFSLWAIRTLGHTIYNWIIDWNNISSLLPDNIYILPGNPKFLGYIPQRFRVWRGQPSSEYANFIPRIDKNIISEIVKPLKELNSNLVPFPISKLKLGEVKDFSGLAPRAQFEGVPIEDSSAGTAEQRHSAKIIFEKIARRIISNINASSEES